MWFRKAAEQRDSVAEFLLGNQYANGKGVPQDYREAMIWFQRAAEQGHPVAKLYLGVMYAEGRGVPQDYIRAYMWFILSAAQGEQGAVKTLEMAERRITPSSDKRSAKARTRLETSYAANSSLKSVLCGSPNVQPEKAARSAPLGNSMALSAASGQLTKVLLAMMRLSLI
jgi:uncharacterized protein